MNSNLSRVLVGLTLNTKPEGICRAMIEATAFGTRMIIETYENSGIRIEDLYACGGLIKNSMLLQIYSDIAGRTIRVAASSKTMALGAAILGILTADSKNGRSSSYADVVTRMTKAAQAIYQSNPENQKIYEILFKEYLILYDYFWRQKPSLMKSLKFPRD
jgi:L-ribulokinase